MALQMTTLKHASNGDWIARKGIPADVRKAYSAAFHVAHEERFRRPRSLHPSRVKAEFAEWLAEVEGRIARIRETWLRRGVASINA